MALFGRPVTRIWRVPGRAALLQTKACAKAHADGRDPASVCRHGRCHHHDCARRWTDPLLMPRLFVGLGLTTTPEHEASASASSRTIGTVQVDPHGLGRPKAAPILAHDYGLGKWCGQRTEHAGASPSGCPDGAAGQLSIRPTSYAARKAVTLKGGRYQIGMPSVRQSAASRRRCRRPTRRRTMDIRATAQKIPHPPK